MRLVGTVVAPIKYEDLFGYGSGADAEEAAAAWYEVGATGEVIRYHQSDPRVLILLTPMNDVAHTNQSWLVPLKFLKIEVVE